MLFESHSFSVCVYTRTIRVGLSDPHVAAAARAIAMRSLSSGASRLLRATRRDAVRCGEEGRAAGTEGGRTDGAGRDGSGRRASHL